MSDQQDLFGVPKSGLSIPSAKQVVPFGKYKSQPYEVLLTDASYAMYLLSSMYAKLQHQHPMLLAFLVGRYGLPDSTPEHNRLQNRFLDESFAIRFAVAASPRLGQALASLQTINLAGAWANYARRELLAEKEHSSRRERWEPSSRLSELKAELLGQAANIAFNPSCGVMAGSTWRNPVAIVDLEFEKDGADVSFSVIGNGMIVTTVPIEIGNGKISESKPIGLYGESLQFRVEVKPIVGDDYPAILRAMKAVRARQLLVGEYTGTGATWNELVRVFELSGITAVLLDDVENTEPLPMQVEIRSMSRQEAEAVVLKICNELTIE